MTDAQRMLQRRCPDGAQVAPAALTMHGGAAAATHGSVDVAVRRPDKLGLAN